MTAEAQRANARTAAIALAEVARDHDIVVAHGSGPQVGLLALQAAAYKEVPPFPLDIISAVRIGMLCSLIEQELANALPQDSRIAPPLTNIKVVRDHPACARPYTP